MKMHLYKITYRESRDSETQTTTFRGYDADHAMERFIDSVTEECGDDYFGLENIISAVRVKVKNGITRHYAGNNIIR